MQKLQPVWRDMDMAFNQRTWAPVKVLALGNLLNPLGFIVCTCKMKKVTASTLHSGGKIKYLAQAWHNNG